MPSHRALVAVPWDKATPEERQDIVAALFGEVRVRDKRIVSATLALPRYAPLIASSEARRLRLVRPSDDDAETVGLAPPDGRGALAAKPEEKLAAYLQRRRCKGRSHVRRLVTSQCRFIT